MPARGPPAVAGGGVHRHTAPRSRRRRLPLAERRSRGESVRREWAHERGGGRRAVAAHAVLSSRDDGRLDSRSWDRRSTRSAASPPFADRSTGTWCCRRRSRRWRPRRIWCHSAAMRCAASAARKSCSPSNPPCCDDPNRGAADDVAHADRGCRAWWDLATIPRELLSVGAEGSTTPMRRMAGGGSSGIRTGALALKMG